jgi:short-subunit dehydrogenase
VRDFRGKQALITGAAGGIGRALATQLAQAGAALWLVDVDGDSLEQLATELRQNTGEVRTSVVDLTRREEIAAVADQVNTQWRGLDLLINNAGVAFYGPTHQMTESQWDRLMGINLLAPIHLTRLLLPALLSREGSHIANMCSVSGLVAGGRFNAYHTTKFGLVGFTEALRAEYGRAGLGVTAICPGPVQTNLYRDCQTGKGNPAPEPPGWVCASSERVAKLTLRAIRGNRRMVLITPLAHLLFNLKKFLPGLIDFMNTFSKRRLPFIGSRYEKPRPTLEELLARQAGLEAPAEPASRRAA